MSGFFRMEVKTVSRQSIRGNGSVGKNNALHAAAYIDAKKYEQNSVHAAAYISGNKLENEKGETFDYRIKKGVEASFVMLPPRAPEKYLDPETLWSDVDNMEKGVNAVLYREWIICFDKHLTSAERMKVAREFGQSLVDEGMAVHIALHSGKEENGNFHMHILAPTRGFDVNGEWDAKKVKPRRYALDENGERIPVIDQKTGMQKVDQYGRPYWKREPQEFVRSFNDTRIGNVSRWRESFCEIENQYLPKEFQVTHLSYRERGIDKIPGQHLGKAASNVQRKLNEKVDALSDEKKQEYLNRIEELFAERKKNRTLEDTLEWNDKYDELKAEIKDDLSRVSSYQPQKKYILQFEQKRTQQDLEEAFFEILKYYGEKFRQEQVQKETAENTLDTMLRISRVLDYLLLLMTYGMTQSMKEELIQSEYSLKKELLRNVQKEMAEIEFQIKCLKEKGEIEDAGEAERLLEKYRDRIDAIRIRNAESYGRTGQSDSGTRSEIEVVGRRVCELSRELQRYNRELEESSRKVTESARRMDEYRARESEKAQRKTEKRYKNMS